MRFVFVRRNPYVVHASTMRLMEKFLEHWSLQSFDKAELERAVLQRHALLLERYIADLPLVPDDRLIEVCHEDLVADPVATIKRVYAQLHLGDFDSVRSRMEAYAASVEDYRTNEYEFDPQSLDAVRQALNFIIDRWGYAPPPSRPVEHAAHV
jgi:hypothetical protein